MSDLSDFVSMLSPSMSAVIMYRVMGYNSVTKRHFPISSFWSDKPVKTDLREDRVYFFSPALRLFGKSVVVGSNVLWLDFDDPSLSLSSFLVPPTCIVSTGGGFHVYWLLDDFCLDPGVYLFRLSSLYPACDLQSIDPTRFLRLPGSYNLKYSPVRQSFIVDLDLSRVYSLADLGLLTAPPPASPPAPSPGGVLGSGAQLWRSGSPGQWFFWGPSSPYKIGGSVSSPYDFGANTPVEVWSLGGTLLLYSGLLCNVPTNLVGYLSEVRVL